MLEDHRRVVGDDIDLGGRLVWWSTTEVRRVTGYTYAAELLHEHDKEGTLSRATVATDGEELLENVLAFTLRFFDFEELVGVVHVTSGKDLHVAQAAESGKSIVEFALAHVPARRFGAKVDLSHHYHGRDCGGGHHPAPRLVFVTSDGSAVLEGHRHQESEHDSEGCPPVHLVSLGLARGDTAWANLHLPHHRQSSTDRLWSGFGLFTLLVRMTPGSVGWGTNRVNRRRA